MTKNRIHWLITLLLTGAVTYLVITTYRSPAPQEPITKDQVASLVSEALLIRERELGKSAFAKVEREYLLANTKTLNTLQYGDAAARINMQMFSDIECPMCRKMHPVMKQIVDMSQGVIGWEYHHFPLARHNPNAAIESQAIECLHEAYGNRTAWVMLEILFRETQGNGKGVESLSEIARSYGLSGSLIENCLASHAHKEKINTDYELGRSLGVNATPAIQITDKQTNKSIIVKGYKTPEQLLAIISELLK